MAQTMSFNKHHTTSGLVVKTLSAFYKERKILQLEDLTFPPSSMSCILGPSGIGKSSFLRALNRLLEEDNGARVEAQISLQGQSLYDPKLPVELVRKNLALILQQPCAFPASIFENVLFGIKKHQRLTRVQSAELVENLLKKVGLWKELKERLKESAMKLSIGQKQRLAVARSLALNPEVLLFDEPTSALDKNNTKIMAQLIRKLANEKIVLVVSHQVESFCFFSDQIFEFYASSDATRAKRLPAEGCPPAKLDKWVLT